MNNYDNAEPKPLKFLVSDGKLVDESGNVIAESDSLQDLYIKSSPQVKKYLLSDGSVVDENNNLIIKNDYFKKVYDQAEPKVAKYLHANGTIDENPGSGDGANLEDNKEIEITENGEIEITPSAGKDGMKKVTATVNVPSDAKEEQTKSVTITENGTTTVSPDSGKVLSSVSITANVQTPKADKYFLWGNDTSRSADNHANDWSFLYTSSQLSHYSNIKPSYYIKGKNSLDEFTQGETVRLYNPGHPTDYVDATVGTTESNTVAITYTVDSHQVTGYISRTKSTIVTALTTFARFDGITTLPKFDSNEITVNGSYLPANDSDGIAKVFVNVPAQTVAPTLVSSTEQITPVLNTPITYQVSDGSGGYLALCRVNANGTLTSKGSSSDVTFLAIDDIISGTANEMSIHASGPGSAAYKITCSVTGSGSGYPYTFTITPTQIGANFTNKIVIVRVK